MTGTSLMAGRSPEDHAGAPKAGASDDEHIRLLVEAHYDFVWRSLRRLGVRDGGVEDAVQRVFLVVARKSAAIRPGSERSFLYQTALRVASDLRRGDRRRREVPASDDPEPADPDGRGADELLDMHRARRALDGILEEMDLELRAVFTLFELDQMTLTEIAELLAIPRGTVASRLRRAKAMFHEKASRSAWQHAPEGKR